MSVPGTPRLASITFDCADPARLAQFWADLLGGTVAHSDRNFATVALAELGIDISGHQPTQLTADLIHAADLVAIVGTQARLDPPPQSTPDRTWDTYEPSLRGIEGAKRRHRQPRHQLAAQLLSATTPSTPPG